MVRRRRTPRTVAADVRDARAGRGRAAGPLVAAGWGVLIIVVGVAALYGGMIGCTYVSWELLPLLFGTRPTAYGVGVGAVAGIAVAFWFTHRGRHWVLRWRSWRLRRTGVRTTATLTDVHRDIRVGPRGGGSTTYRLTLRWTDPGDGERYVLLRRYRFASTSGSPSFEERCATGRTLPILYPPHRPWRLVADVPFAPIMTDLLS